MVAAHVSLPALQNAIRDVCSALDANDRPKLSWASMTENDLWRELVACILASRVRFDVALSAVHRMEDMQLLSHRRRSADFARYEQDIIGALSGEPLAQDGVAQEGRYPFFRIRATQIRQAAERLYGACGSIREFLDDASDVQEARRRLVSGVAGLGPKQASLFLRNAGYATHVAVLDVHILSYMSWAGLTETPLKSVSSVRRYESLEDTFVEHACSFGYPPDLFDVAVWVVVKVAKEEYRTWG